MKGWSLLVFSLIFLIFAEAADDFQTRVVYYGSPLDSVCIGSITNLDLVNIRAVFNGTTMREIKNVLGQTYCDGQETAPSRIVRPSSAWYYKPDRSPDLILFNQEKIVERLGSIIHKIKLKSTIQNPIVFEGVSYRCILFGDGKEQHYGTDIIPPASVYIECLPDSSTSEAKS